MDPRLTCALCLALQLLLPPLPAASQSDLSLLDALDDDDRKPSTTTLKPGAAAGGPGGGLFNVVGPITTTTTKAPTKVGPKVPTRTNDPAKSKPAADDFDLADALDPTKDIGFRDKNKGQEGGFSDSDLVAVSEDETYKPDKGKGGRLSGDGGRMDQKDDSSETTAEVGTIAGIVSAVAMALVGAISSYISYQKKKLCFSIQQSLNVDMTNAERSDTVAAAEPQVQKTLLEPPNTEAPAEVKVVS